MTIPITTEVPTEAEGALIEVVTMTARKIKVTQLSKCAMASLTAHISSQSHLPQR